jgi:hypothetical protein
MPPQPSYGSSGYGGASPGYGYGGYGGNGGGGAAGCACGNLQAESAYSDGANGGAADASASFGSADAGAAAPTPVEVVARAVVGPYETVTVRSDDPGALQTWLLDHDYAIPEGSAPIITDFVERGFDFVALRLKPGEDVRAMRPLRIVSPGADLSLPLRMMKIGSGAQLGITLYVIAEGRYETKTFPDGAIDFSKLVWDYGQGRSNYQELSKRAMAETDGLSFLTEYADRVDSLASRAAGAGMTGSPPLDETYARTCRQELAKQPWPTTTPIPPRVEDGGAGDGGAPDAGIATLPPRKTSPCDDFAVALDGKRRQDVWVTRMRANLPNSALEKTLVLEPSSGQATVTNIHTATSAGAITSRIARRGPDGLYGTYATFAVTAFAVSRVLRRRKRAR